MISDLKILLIGDSCLDQYKIGTVDRLSPEAPVPVIKISDEYSNPGMAANVYENLKKLNIQCDFITNSNQITKTRYIDKRSGQQLLRVDTEPTVIIWDNKFPQNVRYDAIVISDYNKGFLNYFSIETIIKNHTCPIFVDTKKVELGNISAAHVYFKINELEYKLTRSLPSNLIVTLGDRGAMLKTPNQESIFSTNHVEVMDVCGCGDTFLAALVYKFLFTSRLDDSIIFANTAAGITAKHRGNYAPSLEEIQNARH